MKMWIFIFASAVGSLAQESPDFSKLMPAAPRPPIRWIVDYSYPSEAGAATKRTVRVTVDHTKAATKVVETKASGVSTERWFAQGMEIQRLPEVAEPVVIPPDDPPDPQKVDFVRVFFSQFGWLGKPAYKGKEKKFGQEVFVFEGPYGTSSTLRAFLAVESLLPVAQEAAGFQVRYSFAPVEPIELPADFKAALEKYRSQARAAMKPVGS